MSAIAPKGVTLMPADLTIWRRRNYTCTAKEAARHLGVKPEIIYALIDSGAIQSTRIGKDRATWNISTDYLEILEGRITAGVLERLKPWIFRPEVIVPPPSPPLPPEPQPAPRVMRERESLLPQDARWPAVAIPPEATDSVYLLHMGPYYKIGYSNRPIQRVAELCGMLPVRPILIALIVVEYAAALERSLHKRYGNVRANGEWFCLTDEDVQFLIKLQRCAPKRFRQMWDGKVMYPGKGYLTLSEMCDHVVTLKKNR
jgi:excisionase family DNA binding protein